jgi:hypothetical protein
MGWKINLWARALDGDHSHDILELALRHHSVGGGGVYYNLYDAHTPFQIDGNFGACAGIAEMLMQSHTEVIDILPALPSVWQKGSITGLKAIGNFTVRFNWEEGKAQQVTIVSHKGAPLKVRCNHGAIALADAKITVNNNEVAVEIKNGIATIPCEEGDIVVIDFTEQSSWGLLSINEMGLATFYANSPATITEGVKAYVATEAPVMENETGVITMTEIADGIIPAQTGVVIRGEEGNYTFEYTSQTGTPVDGNLLLGYAGVAEYTEVEVPTDGSTNYVLTEERGKTGFYKKEAGFKVYNHKAYLNVPEASGAMKAIRLRFENNDGTTNILEIPTEGVNANAKCYDLFGRRVEKATKGVFIVNGKKVIF